MDEATIYEQGGHYNTPDADPTEEEMARDHTLFALSSEVRQAVAADIPPEGIARAIREGSDPWVCEKLADALMDLADREHKQKHE